MYVRLECYPVLDQLHLALVVLDKATTPTGDTWEPVYASGVDWHAGNAVTIPDLLDAIGVEIINIAQGAGL